MRFSRNRHIVVTLVAAACAAVPATASASPDISPSTGGSNAALSGASPSTIGSDAAQSGVNGWSPSTDRSDAAQSGMDAGNGVVATASYPPADFRGGDTQADFPGASGAPAAAPTTIEVVRPERTIVRDVDEALPLILSGTALLLVIAGLAVTLVHAGMVPRFGRGH